MKVKCHRCGHEWDTSSDMEQVTCPNCGYKTRRTEPESTRTSDRKLFEDSIKDIGAEIGEEISVEKFWQEISEKGGKIGLNQENVIYILAKIVLSGTNYDLKRPSDVEEDIFDAYDFVLVIESEGE